MKTLDLTYASYCNKVVSKDIEKRNKQARAYSDSIKGKRKQSIKDCLLMLASIICVNATVLYCLVDALI